MRLRLQLLSSACAMQSLLRTSAMRRMRSAVIAMSARDATAISALLRASNVAAVSACFPRCSPLPAHAAASPASVTPRRCFSSSSADPSDDDLIQWRNFNQAGLKYLSEGSFEKAALLFTSAIREPAIQRRVHQYLALSNLGIAFRHLGRHNEARDVLLQSLAALRGFSEVSAGMLANVHREAALCCEALGNTKEAEELLRASLKLYSQYAASHATPAAGGASTTSAQEQRKHTLEQASTHYTLALLLHKTGLSERAAAQGGDSSTAATPSSPARVPADSPQLRESVKQYESALHLLTSVHGSDPKSPGALLSAPMLSSLGTLQDELGESDAAQATLLRALDIYKEHNDPRLLPLLEAYMAMLQRGNPALAQVVEAAKEEANKRQF